MPLDAIVTFSEVALAGLVAIPAVVVAVVLILAATLFVAAVVLAASAWALTRASAEVLGEGEEIWR